MFSAKSQVSLKFTGFVIELTMASSPEVSPHKEIDLDSASLMSDANAQIVGSVIAATMASSPEDSSQKQTGLDSAMGSLFLSDTNTSESSTSDNTSESSTDTFHDCECEEYKASARMSENWIEAMETKEEISSSMDLILKSISKLQVDYRERMATASSSVQSDDLQCSIDETLELVRKTDQKIKKRLEENEVKATTKLRRTWYVQMFVLKLYNTFLKEKSIHVLEFQRKVVQSQRQDGNKISTDDFCNWIEVIVLIYKGHVQFDLLHSRFPPIFLRNNTWTRFQANSTF